MLKDIKFWVLTVLATICLAANIWNAVILVENNKSREFIAKRQQFINESITLNKFSNNLINALANLAAQTGDENIKKLLADNGITYTVNNPSPTELKDGD